MAYRDMDDMDDACSDLMSRGVFGPITPHPSDHWPLVYRSTGHDVEREIDLAHDVLFSGEGSSRDLKVEDSYEWDDDGTEIATLSIYKKPQTGAPASTPEQPSPSPTEAR